jgi:ribonuclease VapC
MIAADSSAILAIIFREPEREAFVEAIEAAGKVLISAVSAVETRIVAYRRRGVRHVLLVDDMLSLPHFEVTPPDQDDMEAAFAAFMAFGKGTGGKAGLNFGDVFSYALAKVRDLPLLYKGNDFAETDLRSAVPNPTAHSCHH